MSLSHKHVGPKILGKSKSMSSPEQNYFSLFAMRYPVIPGLIQLFKFENIAPSKSNVFIAILDFFCM